MIRYYKTEDNITRSIETLEKHCWINMINPDAEEIEYVATTLGIEKDFLLSALDEEESSRIEVEDNNQILTIIDIPVAEEEHGAVMYSTMPLGIIVTADNIITVCLKENSIISEFEQGRVRGMITNFKARFIFQILYRISVRYLQYLKQIDKISQNVEGGLRKSMKNQELIQLLDLEKSLVYFSTSLKANEATIKKLSRGRIIKLYEEDEDLLEDVLVELSQAIEMCNIYSSILSGTMEVFASIISNNLNIVMKYLASITIIMAVPTMIASFYGMNVGSIPLATAPYAFWIVVGVSAAATAIAGLILKKSKML